MQTQSSDEIDQRSRDSQTVGHSNIEYSRSHEAEERRLLFDVSNLPYLYCPWDGCQFHPNDIVCRACGTERLSSAYTGPLHTITVPSRSARWRLSGERGARTWRKILYEPQDYADNYVDETFLIGLRRNLHARRYTFSALITNSLIVTQQLSLVALFLVVFDFIDRGYLSAFVAIPIEVVLTVFGWAVAWQHYEKHLMQSLHSFCLFTGFLVVLSPVLRTLTDPVSSDTIWAFTIGLLTIHLLFHDYRPFSESRVFFSPISLNAGIFASVVLASRLSDIIDVFAFLFCSLTLFMGAPLIRHHLHQRLSTSAPSVFLFLVTGTFLVIHSSLAFLTYLAILVFVTFICPFWLIYIQKYKNEINGPWDEADLRL